MAEILTHLNLKEIFNQINNEYFDGMLTCAIKLGRKYNGVRRRMIRLGSYNFRSNTIRIHPELQHRDIPLFLIRYIVYHEMTHAWCYLTDPEHRNHQGIFRGKEKTFADFHLAKTWLRNNKSFFIQ